MPGAAAGAALVGGARPAPARRRAARLRSSRRDWSGARVRRRVHARGAGRRTTARRRPSSSTCSARWRRAWRRAGCAGTSRLAIRDAVEEPAVRRPPGRGGRHPAAAAALREPDDLHQRQHGDRPPHPPPRAARGRGAAGAASGMARPLANTAVPDHAGAVRAQGRAGPEPRRGATCALAPAGTPAVPGPARRSRVRRRRSRGWTRPRATDSVEYFASANDLCRAYAGLSRQARSAARRSRGRSRCQRRRAGPAAVPLAERVVQGRLGARRAHGRLPAARARRPHLRGRRAGQRPATGRPASSPRVRRSSRWFAAPRRCCAP